MNSSEPTEAEHLDVVNEGNVFILDGFLSPDQRRVRLCLFFFSLLHPTHGFSAVYKNTTPKRERLYQILIL